MSEKLNGLPPGWEVAPLKALVEIGRGNVEPKDQPDRWFNYIALENVSKGTGKIVDFEPTEGRAIGSTKAQFHEGDVLYGKLRPYLQKAVVAPFDGVSATDLIPLAPATGVDARYIQSFLLGPQHLDYITPLLAGIRMPRLRKGDIEGMPVPIPGPMEQKRIVAKIEALQERSASAKEALDAIPPLLEKFRQSVLAAAFRGDLTKTWRDQNPDVEPATELLKRIRAERRARWIEDAAENGRAKAEARVTQAGKPWSDEDNAKVLEKERVKAAKKYKEPEPVDTEGLPELPEGWCWARWDELSERVTVGFVGSMAKEYVSAGIPFLRSQNVRTNRYDSKGLKFITDEFHSRLAKSALIPGDIAVVRSGVNAGMTCVVPPELPTANCADLVVIQRPFVSSVFGSLYMNMAAERNISEHAVGVAIPHFNTKSVAMLPVPVPPSPEQEKIVGEVQEKLDIMASLQGAASNAADQLASLNQSILAKAFRGELVPQDPEDEPASILLERIRAERKAAKAAGGKKKRGRGRGRRKKAGVAT